MRIQRSSDFARVLIQRVVGLGKGHVSALSPIGNPNHVNMEKFKGPLTQSQPLRHIGTPRVHGTKTPKTRRKRENLLTLRPSDMGEVREVGGRPYSVYIRSSNARAFRTLDPRRLGMVLVQ